jgi:hypothetical protein
MIRDDALLKCPLKIERSPLRCQNPENMPDTNSEKVNEEVFANSDGQ